MEPPKPCCFESCMCRLRHRRHGITFHEFPKNDEIRSKWLAVVRIDRHDPKWVPANDSKVCSLHFCRAQFLSKRVLHSRAVPTAKYDIPKFMRGYKRSDESQDPSENIDLDDEIPDDDIPDDSMEFPPIDETDEVMVENFEVEFEQEQLIPVAAPPAPADNPREETVADQDGNMAEQPPDDKSDQPIHETEDKPAEKPVKEPVEILLEKLHNETAEKSVCKIIQKPKDEQAVKSAGDDGEPARKKAKMSSASKKKSGRKPIKKNTAQTLAANPGDKPMEKPDNKQIEKQADNEPDAKGLAKKEAADGKPADMELANKGPTDKEQPDKEPAAQPLKE